MKVMLFYGFRFNSDNMTGQKSIIRVYSGTESNALKLKSILKESGIESILKNDSEDMFLMAIPMVVDLYIDEDQAIDARQIVKDFVMMTHVK